MNLDECPAFLMPRLRLFLSADIVGSTALKQSPFAQSKVDQRASWFSKIQGFYFEAHRAFRKEFDDHRASSVDDALVGPDPELWKTIGDEVLFIKELSDHRQLIYTLRCWMRAVDSMRSFIKKGNSRLDVKCTAWIAGFPFRNSEVAVESGASPSSSGSGDWFLESGKILNRIYAKEPDVDAIVDYIGPSIDIGFRLSQFSSSRKFIISVDIAYILAIANPGQMVKDPVFAVYYDQSDILKGVLGGLRYPVFWLDLSPSDSLDRYEDTLTGLAAVDRDRLREYCNGFYDEYTAYTFPPFIVSKTEQQIRDKPPWYESDHSILVRNFTVEKNEEQNTGNLEPGEAEAEAITISELSPQDIADLENLLVDLLKGGSADIN
ncbi:hypothetical protein GCM10011395_34010 [Sphingomonas psychrolutea]|uniref:Uncharacterized protein n=2 Tax=Sphingomonas psychrolutea TaxID=1259676 RepID=A0ABQ1H6I0_9SPHN|nr:hypothetical protein GCM10011395_34010 [Sphingomonas psychrolutea]